MKFGLEADKKNKGENVEILRKDSKPPSVNFKKGRDNGTSKLHKARFCRAPLAHPKHWMKNMPQRRHHVYKNMRFEFSGTENSLNDRTISSCHDRAVALQLKHFSAGITSDLIIFFPLLRENKIFVVSTDLLF